MVLCRQVIPGGDCEDEFVEESGSCKRPEPEMPCDCIPIVGRDHLKTERARKFRCKSKRIRHLAQPKYNNSQCCETPQPQRKQPVEVIRTDEETPLRIKMLAYPEVRKLVSSREAYKGIVEKQWHGRFEELIRRSMLTMYSRIANVLLPEKSQRRKWTRTERQRHCEWLKKRALPKAEKSPTLIKRKKVPLINLIESMFVLSQPRAPRVKYAKRCGYVSNVKYSAKTYEATERIQQLAQPKRPKEEDDVDENNLDPFAVNPQALKFTPSKCFVTI